MTQLASLEHQLGQLIAARSVSSADPALDCGNRPVIELLAQWCEDRGFDVELQAVGTSGKLNLIATRGEGEDGLVLAGHTDTVPCDPALWTSDPYRLAERDGRCAAALAAVEAEWGGVEILVNNAGIATRAVAEHIADSDMRQILAVNFLGPLELIRRVLPGMRERRRGRIITVSSVGGMMAMPTMAAYSASKFAIEGACESLWYEVRPWGIGVSLVEPGFINSDSFTHTIHTRRSARAVGDDDDPYHAHYAAMAGMIGRLMRGTWATPEHVASVIIRTIRAKDPRLRVRATPDALLFDYLRRWLPRRLYHRVLYACLPDVRRWGAAR